MQEKNIKYVKNQKYFILSFTLLIVTFQYSIHNFMIVR